VIDVEGFIVRLAFSRLVDQKRIGDLEMAKRISNACEPVGKKFQNVLWKKIIRKYFRNKKISTEIPES
jgi:ABC-type transporter MlaC component